MSQLSGTLGPLHRLADTPPATPHLFRLAISVSVSLVSAEIAERKLSEFFDFWAKTLTSTLGE